jgi:hypothetical protein
MTLCGAAKTDGRDSFPAHIVTWLSPGVKV